MVRTYATKRRTLLDYGRATSLSVRERCGFEPGTCKSTRSVALLGEFFISLIEKYRIPLSSETDVRPVKINTALNREAVELAFNQSYRFEVTTDPIGPHYVTS
jgi:hypothetical protein